MKKKIAILLTVMLLMSGVVYATNVNGNYKGNPIIKVFSNGKEIKVKGTPAIIYQGTTMIPLSVLKELGIKNKYDYKKLTIDLLPSNSSVEDSKINTIEEIQYFLKTVRESLQKNNFKFGYLELALTGEESYIRTNMIMDGMKDQNEIVSNVAMVTSMTIPHISLPVGGVFINAFLNGEQTGSIFISHEDAISFYNKKINIVEFQNKWVIENL